LLFQIRRKEARKKEKEKNGFLAVPANVRTSLAIISYKKLF
jgi:hypothetical protein